MKNFKKADDASHWIPHSEPSKPSRAHKIQYQQSPESNTRSGNRHQPVGRWYTREVEVSPLVKPFTHTNLPSENESSSKLLEATGRIPYGEGIKPFGENDMTKGMNYHLDDGAEFGCVGRKSSNTPKAVANFTWTRPPVINKQSHMPMTSLPTGIKSESVSPKPTKQTVRDLSTSLLKPRPPLQGSSYSVSTEQLLDLVDKLKNEISGLKLGLKKSENLRKGMELRMAQMQRKENNVSLSKVKELNNTKVIKDPENNTMGILWNLSSESETLRILDEYLRKLEHSSRCPGTPSCNNIR